MNTENKIKKVIDKVSEVVDKDVMPKAKQMYDGSKVFVDEAGKKITEITNEAKEKAHKAKVEWERLNLRPIFTSSELEGYDLVCICEKDKKRAESEACIDSIGHYEEVKNGLNVLNIYKKYVDRFYFEFYPNDKYGFYYVSPIDANKLIRLENYFEYIKEQRVAELHNIAYKIGASYVQVSYKEQQKTLVSSSYDFKEKVNTKSSKVDLEQKESSKEQNYSSLSILDSAHYHDNEPSEPELHYFNNDTKINTLIDAALKGQADDRHINIKYNTSIFMNKDIALKIDTTLKQYGANGNGSIASEVEKESRTELDFYVEFPKI